MMGEVLASFQNTDGDIVEVILLSAKTVQIAVGDRKIVLSGKTSLKTVQQALLWSMVH